MLNQETKRHIDNARQILVGVVPNPSSQIDQITNALIYKFMDDIDEASINAGGDASFFVGDLEKYSWGKLMDSKVTNQERLNLYSEALTKFSQSAQLPELFRSIFKSAFLPHRSPEVLDLFLKEIKYFDYSNSEELGNAYEYLLSIMSSQGDAGQFRTPRHIIDFIVEATNPSKDDRILDPACGTAGFLISSYKHILKQHDGIDDPEKKEKPLTPQEKQKLMQNFHGYDIDPTMERIAAVNMYLHQFKNPKIFQYDTLSSDEKWSEKFDVILANPPFMSPKGGIKPHSKFSIPSNRSEVLFVDYIMNHLRPEGRAGIIVPEGIIFQSGNAYKTLRKNLIDGGLYAVVSLPSGVFQPYSGVKTSVLLLNKKLAKQSSELLFIKIENDGFDLGAQRRSSANNDLPQALEILQKWQIGEKLENKLASFVEKEQVAENGDYNLSGDRYRVATDHSKVKWQIVRLGDVCKINPKKSEVKNLDPETEVSFIPMSDLSQDGSNFEPLQTKKLLEVVGSYTYFAENDVILARVTPCFENGKAGIVRKLKNGIGFGSSEYIVLRPTESILPEMVYAYITQHNFNQEGKLRMTGTGGLQRVPIDFVENFKIPLPPLEVQEQIVRELNGYQSIIQGAKQITQNWKPKIDIDPSWPVVLLEEASDIQRGKFSHRPRNEPRFYGGKYPFIQTGDIVKASGGKIEFSQTLNEEGLLVSKLFQPPIVVITIAANIGDTAVLDFPSCFPDSVVALTPKSEVDVYYLELVMQTKKQYLNDAAPQAAQKNINIEILKTVKIPLPSLEIQQEIVAKIESERALVKSAKKLIEIYEQKTKATINKLWEE